MAGIVGFGTDSDLFVAIPLGVFAGSFTALVLYYWDAKPVTRKPVPSKSAYREPQSYRAWQEQRREFGKKVSRRPAEWR